MSISGHALVRARGLRRLVVALVCVVTVSILSSPAAAATDYEVYKVEAEAFVVPSTAAVVTDSTASLGKAIILQTNNSALTRSSITPSASTIQVRAAGIPCSGAPKIQLRLDGVNLKTISVTATTWTKYSVSTTIAPGAHTIGVKYVNDYSSSSCDRNVKVDFVAFRSSVPINVGISGSRCEASDHGLVTTPAPPGVSTTSLGSAPAYYEHGSPTGEYAGSPPKGIMLVIHGGAWFVTGPGIVGWSRPEADRWRARGWATINMSYRSCAASADDVLWFYDAVQRQWPGFPICASGGSAGGHLSMLLAGQRPLACAVSRGGPMDLGALPQQTAYDPATGGSSSAGPLSLYYLAVAAFGADQLAAKSPSTHGDTITAALLFATAQQDPLIPLEQADDMAAAVRAVRAEAAIDVLVLAPGTVPFVHAKVDQAAWDQYIAAEAGLGETAATQP